jgi:asparagine synthase (glutamine-hydrolysing)
MCGILGTLQLDGPLDPATVDATDDSAILKHRGPDGHGNYLDSHVYLGHRRLSIIDIEGGKQPIANEDGTCCVILNGEIYNFRELRPDLEAKGHLFRTASDTEVIVHAYEEWGLDFVQKLRGMFSIAVWDAARRRLVLARDRLGIKPLFYALVGHRLYFGSEIKAITRHRSLSRAIDPVGLFSYFSLSYIPAPSTIFASVKKLLPGHLLIAENGAVRTQKYWDLAFVPDHTRSLSATIDELRAHLEEAVRLHMISDVPLGSFLSGGIDSGIVTALMSQVSSEPVRTFCMGFGGNIGGHLDERPYAKQIADRCRTVHHEQEVLPHVADVIFKIVTAFDEPFADDSAIPSYYLSELTRQHVKVALSGLGGDELFGGYERYLGFQLSSTYNLLPRFVREQLLRSLVDSLPERANGRYTVNHLKRFVRSASLSDDMRYFGFVSSDPHTVGRLFAEPAPFLEGYENCKELVLGYYRSVQATTPLDRVFYCDIKTYLPDDILACTDRTSMAHSLEVRVPFLDHKLMEFCATIPSQFKIRRWTKKYVLRRIAADLLPSGVLNHRKQGFASPMTQWLRSDLKKYATDALHPSRVARRGLFNPRGVQEILSHHFERKEIFDKLIWSLLIFDTWHEMYAKS